jgi:hypothetical protein
MDHLMQVQVGEIMSRTDQMIQPEKARNENETQRILLYLMIPARRLANQVQDPLD